MACTSIEHHRARPSTRPRALDVVTGAKDSERDNKSYYFHDSKKGYTHGCTEVEKGLFDKLNDYRDKGNTKIDVIIDYGKTLIIQQMEERKKMRIIKCLILFVLQSTTCHLNAQSIKECLKIDSVQTIYDIGSSVSFHFSNNCEENIYISISLEKRVGGKWFIFTQDIFHVPNTYKVQNVIVLKGCEVNRKEEWEIKGVKYKKKCENVYRFKYNIGRKLNDLSYIEYSNIFHIKN